MDLMDFIVQCFTRILVPTNFNIHFCNSAYVKVKRSRKIITSAVTFVGNLLPISIQPQQKQLLEFPLNQFLSMQQIKFISIYIPPR